jgi:AcrR family transcriptional regulator
VTEVAALFVDDETLGFLLSQAMAPLSTSDRVAPVGVSDPLEERVVEAMLECVAKWGLAKTTADDIARTAGISRATLYRVFPGGKDVAFDALVRHETARFFHTVTTRLDAADALDDLLVIGIVEAARFLRGHRALGYLLAHEPERVLPAFTFDRLERTLAVATAFAAPYLGRFVAPDAAAADAEWIVRILLSYAINPSPMLDLTDDADVRRFVTTYLTPALAAVAPDHAPKEH